MYIALSATMRQPSSLSTAAPAPSATETVVRPEPGLGRGRWEAPAWVFWVILAAVVTASVLYLLRSLGLLKLRKESPRS